MPSLSIILIRLSIYTSPLLAFSFSAASKGILQPSLLLIVIAFFVSLAAGKKEFSLKDALGNPLSYQAIFFFLLIIILSTIFSFLAPGFNIVSLYKSIGVLVSLLVFLSTYTIISFFNSSPQHAKIFIKDFIFVSIVVSLLIIFEFFLAKTLNVSFYSLIKGIHDHLPYSSMSWRDAALHDRYKGILNEPADVGNFILPAFSAASLKLFSSTNIKSKLSNFILLVIYAYAVLLSASITSIALMIFMLTLISFNKRVFCSLKSLSITLFISLIFTFGVISVSLELALRNINLLHPVVASRLYDIVDFLNTQHYDNYSNLSVQVMLNSYNSTLVALQKNPILGTGLGNFSISYDLAASANFIETRLNQHDGYSMLLRLLVEVGIVGLVTFLGVFAVRFSQGEIFLRKVRLQGLDFLDAPEKSKYFSRIYLDLEQHLMMVNAAAFTCLLNAFLNYPTYWNVTLPILFGLCYKLSYSLSISPVIPTTPHLYLSHRTHNTSRKC